MNELKDRMKQKVDRLNSVQLLFFLAYIELSAFCEWVKDIPRSWAMWQAGKQ